MFKSMKRASSERQYWKAVEQSTGLEKIRLLTRRTGLNFGSYSPDSFFTPIFMMAQMNFCDGFYGVIESDSKMNPLFNANHYDELATTISSDSHELESLSSFAFGTVLGVFLFKTARLTKTKIDHTKVKDYIYSFNCDESLKDNIFWAESTFIAYTKNDPDGKNAAFSDELSEIAHYLTAYNNDIDNDESFLARSILPTAIIQGMSSAFNAIEISSLTLEEMKKIGLIR